MKIGINYLKLKDIKPGTVLTIVEFSDIEKIPSDPTVFIHGKNKKAISLFFCGWNGTILWSKIYSSKS